MNTLLYKNIISHTLFSKGWWLLCVRDEPETGTDCYIDPVVLLSHLGWVAQTWVTEGPKPSLCRWLSFRHLVPNWLQLARTASGTWLYNCLTFTCFCYFPAYLHRCISWLTAQLRVYMLQNLRIVNTKAHSIQSSQAIFQMLILKTNRSSLFGRVTQHFSVFC